MQFIKYAFVPNSKNVYFSDLSIFTWKNFEGKFQEFSLESLTINLPIDFENVNQLLINYQNNKFNFYYRVANWTIINGIIVANFKIDYFYSVIYNLLNSKKQVLFDHCHFDISMNNTSEGEAGANDFRQFISKYSFILNKLDSQYFQPSEELQKVDFIYFDAIPEPSFVTNNQNLKYYYAGSNGYFSGMHNINLNDDQRGLEIDFYYFYIKSTSTVSVGDTGSVSNYFLVPVSYGWNSIDNNNNQSGVMNDWVTQYPSGATRLNDNYLAFVATPFLIENTLNNVSNGTSSPNSWAYYLSCESAATGASVSQSNQAITLPSGTQTMNLNGCFLPKQISNLFPTLGSQTSTPTTSWNSYPIYSKNEVQEFSTQWRWKYNYFSSYSIQGINNVLPASTIYDNYWKNFTNLYLDFAINESVSENWTPYNYAQTTKNVQSSYSNIFQGRWNGEYTAPCALNSFYQWMPFLKNYERLTLSHDGQEIELDSFKFNLGYLKIIQNWDFPNGWFKLMYFDLTTTSKLPIYRELPYLSNNWTNYIDANKYKVALQGVEKAINIVSSAISSGLSGAISGIMSAAMWSANLEASKYSDELYSNNHHSNNEGSLKMHYHYLSWNDFKNLFQAWYLHGYRVNNYLSFNHIVNYLKNSLFNFIFIKIKEVLNLFDNLNMPTSLIDGAEKLLNNGCWIANSLAGLANLQTNKDDLITHIVNFNDNTNSKNNDWSVVKIPTTPRSTIKKQAK